MSTTAQRNESLPVEWHPLSYPGNVWVCPITGIPVEKDPSANFWQRVRLAKQTDNDKAAQRDMMACCKASPLLWMNLWVWTRKDIVIDASGHQSSNAESVDEMMVTWPVHDALHNEFRGCVEAGQSLAVPKSRDMIATWFFLMEALHDLIFNPGKRVVLLSEKMENVAGTPDSMFDRIDYMLRMMPKWMRPRLRRSTQPAVMENLGNGASIIGVATTENSSVSKKALWIGADEAALNPYLHVQWRRWLDVSPCRVAWSSPRGAAEFKRICFSGIRVFPLLYYNHPDKAGDREWRVDENALVTGRAGSRYVWSKWLQHQIDPEPYGKGRDRRDLDENVLCNMDAGTSGVFESDVLVRMIDTARTPVGIPTLMGEFEHELPEGEARDWSIRKGEVHRIKFVPNARGRWRLWCDVAENAPVLGDMGAVMAADISNGLASSNSTVQVADIDHCKLIASYADSTIAPFRLARLLAMVGLWFRSYDGRPALLGGERNGSGEQVIKQLQELEYPRVWSEKAGEYWWFSNPRAKRAVLEDLRAAWGSRSWTYYDVDTLVEAGDYVYGTGDQVFPAVLREDKEARTTHGDRVIAAAVLWKLLQKMGVTPIQTLLPSRNSLSWRIMQAEQREKSESTYTL